MELWAVETPASIRVKEHLQQPLALPYVEEQDQGHQILHSWSDNNSCKGGLA